MSTEKIINHSSEDQPPSIDGLNNTSGKEQKELGLENGTPQSPISSPSTISVEQGDITGGTTQTSTTSTKQLAPIRRAWNWIPPPARYDPENPPKFTIWLNVLFGFVSDTIHILTASYTLIYHHEKTKNTL